MKLMLNTIVRSSVLAMLLMLSTAVLAQRTLRGTVSDAKTGETLVGASVVVTGTTKGTLTDVNGNYELSNVAADAQSLTFSYTGYASSTIPLGSGTTYDATLNSGSTLDEVIVVGYGTMKQREVTSSIVSITNKDFNKGNINDASQLIQGKVPGLVIARAGGDPNGTFDIRLRGVATLGASSSPLIVVDGFIVPNLNIIDPADIERMEILKDGSACAIYGTQGTNGVILITTKKGDERDPQVNYTVQLASEAVAKTPAITDAAEYRALDGNDLGSSTDWANEISQAGISHQHNLSLGGGGRGTTYRISANYRDVNGVLKTSGFKNMNLRAMITQKALNDKMTFDLMMVGNRRNANYSFQEAWRYAFITNPTAPIYNEANTANDGYNEIGGFEQFNPVAMIEQNNNLGQDTRFQYAGRVAYQLAKGLTASAQYSQQNYVENRQAYFSRFSRFRGQDRGGYALQGSTQEKIEQFISMVNYDTDLGENKLALTGGYDYQTRANRGFFSSNQGFPTDAFDVNNMSSGLGNSLGQAVQNSGRGLSKLIAFFGRANFTYQDYLFLSASLRREGSTRFGEGNKWGWFPGVSAGIDLNHFVKTDRLSTLKLRAGYGVTGNQPVDSYRSLALYSDGPLYPMNGASVVSWVPSQNANPNLQWETKNETNVGLDFASSDFRLQGAIDVYRRITKDLLYDFPVPATNGVVPTTLVNTGDLQNNGIELMLSYDILSGDKRTWKSTLNATSFNTKLLTLSDSAAGRNFASFETANVGAPGLNNTPMFLVEEGSPLGQMWGYNYLGVNEDGSPNLDTAAGKQQIGRGLPSLAMGWNNSFTFGNFDFNFLVRGLFGHDLINQYRQFYENNNAGSIQSFNRVKTKYWDDKLTVADFSSNYVEDADFVSLDNLSIGYNIPLPAGSGFKAVRIFANGNRLFYLTRYTGVDPEVRFTDKNDSDNGGNIELGQGNAFAPGVDRRSTYVRTRSVAVGLSFTF